MPAFEERLEEFRCTVAHLGRRLTVTLPQRARYTVAEVLREAAIHDYERYEVRRGEATLRLADEVEYGHVIELRELREERREEFCEDRREEIREEFRCTVIHLGRRLTVTLPRRARYTVAEVLREAAIADYERYEIRRSDVTLRVTDIVEHGHVIELIEVRRREYDGEIRVDVVAFGQRHEVRLPRRDGCYTVEEIMRETRIPNWDRCQFRRGDGYTVTTTTVVENGHVIYVLTKIRGN